MNSHKALRTKFGVLLFLAIASYACSQLLLLFNAEPWADAAVSAPLGYDEFGRNLMGTVIAGSIHSVIFGALAACLATLVALLVAVGITISRHAWLAPILDGFTYVVEAIPVILWVVAFAILSPSAARTGGLLAFILATLPFLARLLVGELRRIYATEFVAVARSQEMPTWHLLRFHILPNATVVLAPAMAQVFGLAVAVDGAIAIAGSVNRTDLNLGVLLIRGKENFLSHPHLMFAALACVAAIYLVQAWFVRHAGQRSPDWVQ